MTRRPASAAGRKPAETAGFPIERVMELPTELTREIAEVTARAGHAAGSAHWAKLIASMSDAELMEMRRRRAEELDEELRGGPWGNAIRSAMNGDASRLAQALLWGKPPKEFRDLLYSLIMHAPWARNRPKHRPPKLNRLAECGLVTSYRILVPERRGAPAGAVDGRTLNREQAIDYLASEYGISPSLVRKILTRHGIGRRRSKSVAATKPGT